MSNSLPTISAVTKKKKCLQPQQRFTHVMHHLNAYQQVLTQIKDQRQHLSCILYNMLLFKTKDTLALLNLKNYRIYNSYSICLTSNENLSIILQCVVACLSYDAVVLSRVLLSLTFAVSLN